MIEWRTLGDLLDSGAVGEWSELARGLARGGVEPARRAACLWVPGRIELFGKHTDYAGGRSLVVAIDRGLRLVVAPREDSTVRWRDLGRDLYVEFDVADPGQSPGDWSNYLRTPARRVAGDFGPLSRGVDVAMNSDLPAAAGLSSSSALLIAAYLSFEAAAGVAPLDSGDRTRLAAYLGAVENGAPFEGSLGSEGVGTFGGSEDQTAILCCAANEVLQARYSPLALERRVAWPVGWRLAVGVSGVHAKKTGGAKEAFNRLAALAADACKAYRGARESTAAHLGAALEEACEATELEAAVRAGAEADQVEDLAHRARQFALETLELVPRAADALEACDASILGDLARRSQEGAEGLLGNQIRATSGLARLAVDQGALGASAFGGGFGGAVWAVTTEGEGDAFLARWRRAYTAAFPEYGEQALFFMTAPAAGAQWLTEATTRPDEELAR